MEGGDLDVVVNNVDQHEGQETDEEGNENGQHHLGEAKVLFPLGRGYAVLLGGGSGAGAKLVLLDVESESNYLYEPVTLSVLASPALSHPVEDGGVAENNCDAGQQKSKDEEKLLRGLAIFPIWKCY